MMMRLTSEEGRKRRGGQGKFARDLNWDVEGPKRGKDAKGSSTTREEKGSGGRFAIGAG